MRILYASQRPPYPFFLGGAARCAHRLLLSLAEDHGAECLAVGGSDYAVTPWAWPEPAEWPALGVRVQLPLQADGAPPGLDSGYPVRLLPNFAQALPRLIEGFRPQVVWSQLEGAHQVLQAAQQAGVPGLLYVHDAEDDPKQLRATAALGCHVVCSSGFLARKVSAVIGRPAQVVYPASDWHFGTARDPAGLVTMINAHAVKGLDTFLEVARQMPQQAFLLLESWKLGPPALAALHERLATLPNVRFEHRVADMRSVYARTRVLLVPSVWEEGFGMVAVEAQSCGIPVVASARGGLPESVGEGGLLIHDHRNVAAWVQALQGLLADPALEQALATRALAHARSADFTPAPLARRLLDVCASPAAPPPRSGWAGRAAGWMARSLGR